MIFKYNDITIEISDSVIDIISSYKQNERGKPESGGMLLGVITNENNFSITKVTIPNKFDKSTRTTFERNKDVAQVIINHEFVNSNGKTIYLGEWHTHPEPHPTPSPQDIKMIFEQVTKNRLNSKNIFLLIVGYQSLFFAVLDENQLVKLEAIEN